MEKSTPKLPPTGEESEPGHKPPSPRVQATCDTRPLACFLGGGIHPKIVSEMLGHSTIAIALDTYSHVIPTMQRQAAAAMDAILSS